MPASGVGPFAGQPVMCPDGLVGRVVEGHRVRLITDRDFHHHRAIRPVGKLAMGAGTNAQTIRCAGSGTA